MSDLSVSDGRLATFYIDDSPFQMHVQGETIWGSDLVLLHHDDDLTAQKPWRKCGFTVQDFLPESEGKELSEYIGVLVRRALEEVTHTVVSKFSLGTYHLLAGDDVLHLQVVRRLQSLSLLENIGIDYRSIDRRISDLCGVPLTCQHADQIASGRFFIRIVRPGKPIDNNPPHRDVWLDRLRNAINLYVPLAGSNDRSSLPLIPGSHVWPECLMERTRYGAIVNGVHYNVPAIISALPELRMQRPRVDPGQVLIFSPYLIHGGGINLNTDETRVSLEIRLWRT